MSAPSTIRVLRSREMYGFVRGKLDATREAVGWALHVFFAAFALTVASSAACLANTGFRAVAIVFCAINLAALWAMRRLEQHADVLDRSLEEAWSECEDALNEFNRERRTEGER